MVAVGGVLSTVTVTCASPVLPALSSAMSEMVYAPSGRCDTSQAARTAGSGSVVPFARSVQLLGEPPAPKRRRQVLMYFSSIAPVMFTGLVFTPRKAPSTGVLIVTFGGVLSTMNGMIF